MKKKVFGSVMPVLVTLVGAALLFYPFISEYLFEHRVDSEIGSYESAIEEMDDHTYDQMLEAAIAYNKELTRSQVQLTDPFIESEDMAGDMQYEDILASDETGIMGYVEIPSISVYLPVYHGTASATLERGIGHLEGTSIPVGGTGTHAVLTGHTGLNKARLFTDLTELKEDDCFYIHILGEVLAYQVYATSIVLPEDTSELLIKDSEDMVTLVTCTPYGINTHRLLVHGERIPYDTDSYKEALAMDGDSTGSQWMNAYKKAVLIGLLMTGVCWIALALLKKLYSGVSRKRRM